MPLFRLSIVGCALFCIHATALAQCQPWPACRLTEVLPKSLSYSLSISVPNTGHVVELTPIDVAFTISAKTIGLAGPEPTPKHVVVCPAVQRAGVTKCTVIPTLRSGQTRSGTIKAVAPWAGKNAGLRVTATIPFGPVVQEAVATFPVYAVYSVQLDGFELFTTKSLVTDTVYASMQGLVTSSPPSLSSSADKCSLVGFTWCALAVGPVEAEDSKFYPMTGQHTTAIGQFHLIPEVQDDLRFFFELRNAGHSRFQKIAMKTGEAFSGVGEIFLSGASSMGKSTVSGTSGVADKLNSFMSDLHGDMFGSCDGLLGRQVFIFRNKREPEAPNANLDAFTKATGEYRGESDMLKTEFESPCDSRGSAYKGRYTVRRDSWAGWAVDASF